MKVGLRSSSRILVVVLAACGAATPPPQSEGASSGSLPADSPSPAGPSTASASDSGSEAPATPELLAGIRAFDAGNFAEARKQFEAASQKSPNDPTVQYNLGLACEKAGDHAAAESAYKAALARKPDLEAAVEELGALYIDQGRSADAVALLRPAVVKHPANGALHENLGVALAANGDVPTARQELEAAAKITPSEPMVHLTLAHWLTAWRAPGATAELDTARDLAKNNLGLIASVGYEYRMAGAFDACIKTFDRAAEIKDGGEVRTERALCKLGVKDDKGARDDLQAAVLKEPSYGPAHYYLAGRLAVERNFAGASAEYSKYLEIEPNGSLVKAAKERLKASNEAMSQEKGSGSKKK
ncbi:MAG: tetratricopeptide repeat protein [Polyangiaceae bacterium]